MKGASRNLATLVMVLLLVLMIACAPAPGKITPTPKPEPTPTPIPTPTPEPTLAAEWGIIEIRVTDPPPADVKSAVVYLTNIEVHKVSGNTSGWIPVIGAPPSFDLLDVIGVEEVLGSANITAGSFTQIRMDVIEVLVETTDNVSYTAEVPSGKLKIVRPFNVGPGLTTVLTLDFDGEKSLVLTGKGKALFKPVVKLLIKEGKGAKAREGEKLEFEGTIENMPPDAPWIGEWVIDGQTVIVNADTVIEGTPEIDLIAKVEALVQPDGSLLAIKIKVEE